MEYGEKMKDIRFEFEIKQKDMADILGVARSTYNQYEQQYDIIPLKILNEFCNYFNISIDYILGFTEDRQYDDTKKEINLKISGQRLRKLRRENKLTQQELANKFKIANSTISLYERGHKLISTATLYSIAKLFNISTDYILGKTEQKHLKKELISN